MADEIDGKVIDSLKDLKKYYKQKPLFYNSICQKQKIKLHSLTFISIILNLIGIIAGAVTKNTLILSSISGTGIALQAFLKLQNYEKKIEGLGIASNRYQHVLNQIETFIRMEGETCNFQMYNEHLLWIDNLVADFLPEIVPVTICSTMIFQILSYFFMFFVKDLNLHILMLA